MDEHVSVASGAGAGFVHQAGAGFAKAVDGGGEVGHLERDVVQAFAALFDEFRDDGIGAGGFEELDAGASGGEHGDVNLFNFNGFAVRGFESELGVEGEGLV